MRLLQGLQGLQMLKVVRPGACALDLAPCQSPQPHATPVRRPVNRNLTPWRCRAQPPFPDSK